MTLTYKRFGEALVITEEIADERNVTCVISHKGGTGWMAHYLIDGLMDKAKPVDDV